MSSFSLRWKRLSAPLQSYWFAAFTPRTLQVLTAKKTRQFLVWAIACAVLLILWAWNWPLILATLAGAGLMGGVYRLQEGNWRSLWQTWQPFLSGSRGKLSIAVGSGALGALGTYLAASIWANTENRWLALGSILQGLGTLLTLILLAWQFLIGRQRREEVSSERWLDRLTAPDPLDRLIAVRHLSALDLPCPRRDHIREFFRYMLSRETDPAVRSALLDNFQRGETAIPSPPLQIPLSIPSIVKRV